MNKRKSNSQRFAIERLMSDIEKKYLTREKMYERILHRRERSESNVVDILGRIEIIDAVSENVKTALQFGDYRRALWYLQLLLRLCEKYF